jgi:hypothetical protein
VRIGAAEGIALLIRLAWHDLATVLVRGVVPSGGNSGITRFQGPVLSGRRQLAVTAIHTRADQVAEKAAGHCADRHATDAILLTADGRTCGAAGNGANNGAGTLLIPWPTGREKKRHKSDGDDRRKSHCLLVFPFNLEQKN